MVVDECAAGSGAGDELLWLQLQALKPRHAALLGRMQRSCAQVSLQVGLGPAQRRQCFGRLLAELDRQGHLVRLLQSHLTASRALLTWFDEPAGDVLHVHVPPATPQVEIERFVQLLDGLLEALNHGRGDLLLRPWASKPASAQAPFLAAHDAGSSEVPPDERADRVVWVLHRPGRDALARLDASLLTYDDEEAAAVGTALSSLLHPFAGRRQRLLAAERVLDVCELVLPSSDAGAAEALALRPPHAFGRVAFGPGVDDDGAPASCLGRHATPWLIQQVLERLVADAKLQPERVAVGRIGPEDAAWSLAEHDADLVISVVLPGADCKNVSLRPDSIVIDLFGVLALRPSVALLSANVMLVQGTQLLVAGQAMPACSDPLGRALVPALLEATLLELEDPQAAQGRRLCDAGDLAALAEKHDLRVNALHGWWGEIDAVHWEAFHARRSGERPAWRPGRPISAGLPALVPLPPGQPNACEHIFRPAHLASNARVIDAANDQSASYAQLQQQSLAHAGRLRSLGLQPGDVVAFAGVDGIEATAVMLACFSGGWVFAPINPAASMAQVEAMVQAMRPGLVLLGPAAAGRCMASLQAWPQLELAAFGELPSEPLSGALTMPPQAPAVMLFTSGSTGTPKAVVHTHADLIACSRNYLPHVVRLRPGDCAYTPSRIFFAYGLNNLVLSLLAGASHVLAVPLPPGQRIADVIARHRVSVFYAVPALFKRVVTQDGPRPHWPALRLCVSAGEKLSASLCRQAREYFGVDVLDGIGNTEALSTFISNRGGAAMPGCTGTLVPGFEARLLNECGKLCRVGEVGVLWIKGNTLAGGYHADASASAAHFDGGWFNTHDMFFIDAAWRFHNVGRASAVIKINACWFSPDLLESTLQLHPAVRECAVCVVHDDHGLPRPRALVVLDEAHGSAELEPLWRELRTLAKDRLGKDHYPHFFAAVSALPRTSSGKLMRNELAAVNPIERSA